MSALELIIRGGTVVTGEGAGKADLGIAEGKILLVAPDITESSRETIDATGLHIFPGVIDAHVHFNEPGRADWEGIETGSRAVAAGGGTMFFDMPLNAHPPTIDAASFHEKKRLAEQKSLVDFALWGGLVPGNLDKLEELAECGVIGFKAFMSNSGIEDFSCVPDSVLREGMKRAARLKLPVAVHAESETLTAQLSAEALAGNHTSIRDYLDSRPIQAELDAIIRAIALAGETGCALHVVHVSSAAGVRLITEARRGGVDATCETCPHYLVLTDEDVERIGAAAKCAPPIRSAQEQKSLREELAAGNILTVGSDHSPSPPGMKQNPNFFKIWGGISGAQHLLPLLLNSGIAAPLLARVTSANIARRFNLPNGKGAIAIGADADLALINLDEYMEVKTADLQYRHQQSPYIGRKLRGAVHCTLLRGRPVFQNRKVVGRPSGRFVSPVHFNL